MYGLLRRLLFLFPAETAHYLSMDALKIICSLPFLRKSLSSLFTPSFSSPMDAFGLRFKNSVGLGAGFDKNALYLRELETLGFGFVEIGTVTPKPQEGNEKPRLFRLPKDKALLNRMGFNNDGVEKIAYRLKEWRRQRALSPHPTFLIGGNIGKNKETPNQEAWQDYEKCFIALHPFVDFFVVNVSSPNTPGLRALQEKESLEKILTHLQSLNKKQERPKPVLLKIAPDLSLPQLDEVIALAMQLKLDGLVATNTTVSRNGLHTSAALLNKAGNGGLSGKPLQKRSTEMVQYIYRKTDGAVPVIGSGGIFNGEDAGEKLRAGAVLIEVWTGFIYKGPFIVKNICHHLAQRIGK